MNLQSLSDFSVFLEAALKQHQSARNAVKYDRSGIPF